MGYDSFECAICYVNLGTNNPCENEGGTADVCARCVEKWFKRSMGRLEYYIKDFINYNPDGECTICGKVKTLFRVPACEDHVKRNS